MQVVVVNPIGPSLVRNVAHIIIRNMPRCIRERPSNVGLRVAVPFPPQGETEGKEPSLPFHLKELGTATRRLI